MNPESELPYQEPDQLSKPNPLSAMRPGERVICEIKRHPAGILGVYAGESLLLIVLAIIAFGIAPAALGGDNPEQIRAIGAVLFLLLAVVSLTFVFITNVVYWGNRWIVTSDSLTQLAQTSLFKKQSSQLSFKDLEDISAEQTGLLSDIFHFGTLRAETAGEHSKFVFPFCPKPNYYAQKILAAREVYEQSNREAVTASQPAVSAAPVQQPPAGPPSAPPPPAPERNAESSAPIYPDQPLQ